MLEQIERRERDLPHTRAHLEQLVEERTQMLDGVVRELRLILGALPLGVIHLVGRQVVRVNPRAVELFGWDEEEMLGLGTECLYPSREDFEEVGAVAYARMAAGGAYRVDRILQRKDGIRFWGRLIGQYVDPDDVGLGSIWIVDDIGRDKALEESLRQAREAAEAASPSRHAGNTGRIGRRLAGAAPPGVDPRGAAGREGAAAGARCAFAGAGCPPDEAGADRQRHRPRGDGAGALGGRLLPRPGGAARTLADELDLGGLRRLVDVLEAL